MENIQYTFLGLEIGLWNDHSALAVIDLIESVGTNRDPVTFALEKTHKLRLRQVNRLPLGTPYIEIPGKVRAAVVDPPPGHFGPQPKSAIAINAGGPGATVIELLREAKLPCGILAAVVTADNNAAPQPGGLYAVPRKELGALLRLAIDKKMLVFPAEIPIKPEIIDAADANAEHDGTAIAIALALWAVTKRQPGLFHRKAA